ncbi:MAG: methylitaconate delta2-delta3-isomerase, partial [Pseudomonadota bacterium]
MNPTTLAIPATYMRGGTSKGVFMLLEDLPSALREAGPDRDRLLLRLIGSPDPYAQHIDGMGGATSSTSKVVLISKSQRPDCDVDYLFGAVAIDKAVIDWSGNCGNLSAAVGPFAIHRGLLAVPDNGVVTVRIWQANIHKKIIAHVPIRHRQVEEMGDFELDGVAFPAAEIKLEFLDPGAESSEHGSDGDGSGNAMFPTGKMIDTLDIPGFGRLEATLINAGIPSVFVDAESLGFSGFELQKEVNHNAQVLHTCELIRAHAAVAMGLATSAEEVSKNRPHSPKLAFFAPP